MVPPSPPEVLYQPRGLEGVFGLYPNQKGPAGGELFGVFLCFSCEQRCGRLSGSPHGLRPARRRTGASGGGAAAGGGPSGSHFEAVLCARRPREEGLHAGTWKTSPPPQVLRLRGPPRQSALPGKQFLRNRIRATGGKAPCPCGRSVALRRREKK